MTEAVCMTKGCENEARMAIYTTRPTRQNMYSTVWWDDRTAPKKAARYCRSCGQHLLSQLTEVLTHEDEPAKGEES